MGSSLKGTQTEKNLLIAFAGESQARNRYTYFASAAKSEGLVQISQIFEETANQEKEHAKRFFKFLEGGDLELTATFPAGKIGTTLENLKAAAAGEEYEWTIMYPEFAKIARAEGFKAVAIAFETISIAEKQHEKRYKTWQKILRRVASLSAMEKLSGVASIVATSTRVKMPLRHVPLVCTHRNTSSYWVKTGKLQALCN